MAVIEETDLWNLVAGAVELLAVREEVTLLAVETEGVTTDGLTAAVLASSVCTRGAEAGSVVAGTAGGASG